MPLTNEDVKTGIGGMMLEIWRLQKELQEMKNDTTQQVSSKDRPPGPKPTPPPKKKEE